MLAHDHLAHLAQHRHWIGVAVAIGTSLFVSIFVVLFMTLKGGDE